MSVHMNQKQALSFLRSNNGVHRTRDILDAGIAPKTLYKLRDLGHIYPLARGLYRINEESTDPHSTYVEIAQKIPKAVFCLISALHFHEIGTQLPYDHWVSLPQGVKEPKVDEYDIQYIHPNKELYQLDIEEHNISGAIIKVYSPTKTVVDCFKHRNKIGIDVAMEALREAIQLKKTSRRQLIELATKCRMRNVMMPYIESL